MNSDGTGGGETPGDFAKHAGKQAAKKTAGKIAEKLVSWLKKVLWQKPIEYIKLKGGKYLKIAGDKSRRKAQVVAESDVPSKYQRKISEKLKQAMRGVSERPQMGGGSRPRKRSPKKGPGRSSSRRPAEKDPTGGHKHEPYPDPRKRQGVRPPANRPPGSDQKKPGENRSSRNSGPYRDDKTDPSNIMDQELENDELPAQVKKQLKDAPPEVVAELAAKDQRIRSYVLKNPGLVDASSRKEAARRIEIMGGAGVSKLPDFSMGHGSGDIDGLLSELGPEWGARLGHNEMGDQLTDAINQASGPDGNNSGNGDGDGGDSGYTSAVNGGDLSGAASGTVDTGTGSTSISSGSGSSGSSGGSSGGASNGVGYSGGAGNGLGSGGSGSGGGGR
ncbi:hypothetical protein [Halococcus sediminicola]|uniref:hypothetical protein n=1 Tax=Halococcus sediminicola TaxID=1264579 RepID=UPI0006786F78|nr:hypothetical protein [Halococcus sediminicola]